MNTPKKRTYTEAFKQRVLQVFGDLEPTTLARLKAHLDTDSPYVGRYIDDARNDKVPVALVLRQLALGPTGLADLKLLCTKQLELEALWVEWSHFEEIARRESVQ